jgi:glycine cleavage system H protein
MSQDMTFMMGKFSALLPGDYRYCRNHMWARESGGSWRFGFTAYAVRLMQDVYFLDWSVNEGDQLKLKQEIGHIETSKAESDLFAPIDGVLVQFNKELLKDPTPINIDNYGAGWLFELTGRDDGIMDVSEYYQFLDQNWEKTQRLLKGHM